MKIKQNKFFTSTIILMLSGFVTKILGLIIKVIYTRIVGSKTIGLYSIVMPSYSLLLTISSLAMPTTIAKLISQKNDINILKNATMIITIINIIIIIFMHLSSPFIANYFLQEPDTYYLLIAMSYTLPFASLACILKGYFYGIQKNIPHVVSNTIEQIIRLIIVITIIPKLIRISYVHAAVGLILTSFVTELTSVIVFICFMQKKDIINLTKINLNKTISKDILELSLPSVASKIIGNICYFFEPVILTNLLIYKGFTNEYILTQYGAYNVYAISTLTIPSFFITAIALALIPEISKYLAQRNYTLMKKRLKQSIIIALLIGLFFTTIIYFFRSALLTFLYHTTLGVSYIKFLAPFFIIFYLEAIYASFMQAINKTKITLIITILSSIVKLLCLSIFIMMNLGIYSLLISEIINIIIVVIINHFYIIYFFNKKGT